MRRAETYRTDSPEATKKLGYELAKRLKAGDCVALTGELGSGKTQFVKGVAEGLDVNEYIKSPSFTIINIYESGTLPLYHIDLYRLGRPEDALETGLEEYIYGRGVCVIEWADKVPDMIPPHAISVRLKQAGGKERDIEIITQD